LALHLFCELTCTLSGVFFRAATFALFMWPDIQRFVHFLRKRVIDKEFESVSALHVSLHVQDLHVLMPGTCLHRVAGTIALNAHELRSLIWISCLIFCFLSHIGFLVI